MGHFARPPHGAWSKGELPPSAAGGMVSERCQAAQPGNARSSALAPAGSGVPATFNIMALKV
jgi:hypothetical protein